MSRMMVVAKREFMEFVQTRTFLIMTLIGPLLMAGFLGLEFMIFSRVGGGEFSLAIVDQTQEQIGQQVAQILSSAPTPKVGKRTHYNINVIPVTGDDKQVRDSLSAQVVAKKLSGYLIIPPGISVGDTANYYGENATNSSVTGGVGRALQRAVQTTRLAKEGIDPTKVAGALKPVELNAEKIGKRGLEGSAEARKVLGYIMIFALYLVTLLYGQAIMNSVLEEKRDKIVEVIVSSARPSDLMLGKVLGIGAGGFLQMLIWVVFAGLGISLGGSLATQLHLSPEKTAILLSLSAKLPHVPLSVGVIYMLFFLSGFFIYSTMFATIGSMVTTNQEAQQMVFPTILPFMIGMFMAMTTLTNPDGSMAVLGSLIPLTAPIVMPARTVLGSPPPLQIALSLALTFTTGLAILCVASKIYRVGIFATGKKPTMSELVRWVRDA